MSERPYIYVIGTLVRDRLAAPVKIGIASDPNFRLRTMQTGSPVELALVAAFRTEDRNDALDAERHFHVWKRKHRLHGEWFDMEPHEAADELKFHLDIRRCP